MGHCYNLLSLFHWYCAASSPDHATRPPSPQLFLSPPNRVSHCPILSGAVGAPGTQCPAPGGPAPPHCPLTLPGCRARGAMPREAAEGTGDWAWGWRGFWHPRGHRAMQGCGVGMEAVDRCCPLPWGLWTEMPAQGRRGSWRAAGVGQQDLGKVLAAGGHSSLHQSYATNCAPPLEASGCRGDVGTCGAVPGQG